MSEVILLNKKLGRYKKEIKWYQLENQTTVTKLYLILSKATFTSFHPLLFSFLGGLGGRWDGQYRVFPCGSQLFSVFPSFFVE